MIITRKIVLVLTLLLILPLCSCFNLGIYSVNKSVQKSDENFLEYYYGYYDSFDDIYLVDSEKNDECYNLYCSFFNPSLVNDFEWEDEDYVVPSKEYIYMAIEADDDILIGSISLFYKANISTKFQVGVFFSDDWEFSDDKICGYFDDVFQRNSDNNILKDAFGKLLYKDFDIPPVEKVISYENCQSVADSWTSFTLDLKKDSIIEDGKYIIIVFYNNTGYANSFSEDEKLTNLSFQVTNLLITSEEIED